MSDAEDSKSPLIQACPGCGGFLDVSEQEPFAQVHCPSCGTLLRVRMQFQNYTIQGVMGVGGMGTVFKALDLNLQRHVALKILRREYTTSDADIGKLEREARITAMVNHPNVVKIFSFGSDHGQFYLAMELVERGSLDDLLEIQGQVAEIQVLDIGIQIASGLQAAHRLGLIHRDVKPGNILFSDAHTTKIVDFGLAIVMEEEAAQRGEIWGTPYYVAPEKLDNRPEDFRSDIYSLGGTLFHALAGRPPYEAQTASLVALKHLKSQPVSLQAFAPDVSSETAYVINKTLHKDPEGRYQSYDELLEHLNYAKERVAEAAAGNRSRTRQRVVVDSEETQARMGGIVLALLAILLITGLGLFFFRNSIFPKKSATTTEQEQRKLSDEEAAGITKSELEERYVEARQLIATADFASAQSAFAELLKSRSLKEPGQTWLRLHYGLACYLAGDADAGDEFFKELAGEFEDQKNTEAISDAGLLNALLEATRNCTQDGPTSGNYAALLDTTGPEALTSLIYAARNWSKSAYEDAGPFLQSFRSARVGAALKWLEEYKPLAEKYYADYDLLRKVQRKARAARTPEQKKAAAALANESAVKVQTTGGLAGFLREYAKILASDAEKASAAEAGAKAAAAQAVENRARDAIRGITPQYLAAIKRFDFDEASAVLDPLRKDANIAGSNLVKNQGQIVDWLKQFKSGLISDLSAAPFTSAQIKNKAGAVLGNSIRSATKDGVEVATAYGATRVPWTELPPPLLVDIASKLAATKTGTAASEALWLAGVFAHESGMTQRGKDLLLAASQSEDSLKNGLAVFFEVAPSTEPK